MHNKEINFIFWTSYLILHEEQPNYHIALIYTHNIISIIIFCILSKNCPKMPKSAAKLPILTNIFFCLIWKCSNTPKAIYIILIVAKNTIQINIIMGHNLHIYTLCSSFVYMQMSKYGQKIWKLLTLWLRHTNETYIYAQQRK